MRTKGFLARSAAIVVALFLVTGCQATGMGWIPSSSDPAEKATFGFVYDGTTQTFSGSYHDHGNGVRFKGTGVLKAGPPPVGLKVKGGCLFGEPAYESQDPDRPGAGTVTLLLCDAEGEGAVTADDLIMLLVVGGPYSGYSNAGNPSGNITVTSP
ncbi:MAG: hypothetical protein AUI15_31090 [Actinobacteria bacterium 13_2_20CM_2_66_6]|nr:MAG: hypothetical protein AUI15_31090 [Actinobacteria bacterium 13_2_20CM_2_66_6]